MNTALVNKLKGDTIPEDQQHGTLIGGVDYATDIFYPLAISSTGAIPITPAPGTIIDVNLVEAAGMTVNVTAGDIDIHTTHTGANFDSMRIGDGTDLLGVNTDTSLAVGNLTGVWVAGAGAVSAQTQRVVTSTATRTPAKTTVVAGGTVAAGAQSVTFITDSAYTGTILGDTTLNNTVLTFAANGNDTLGAIVYTVTAGSMQILTVV